MDAPFHYSRRTAKIARYLPMVRGGRHGVPISLQVSLTDACFNRCIMCDHPSRPIKTIPLESWLRFLHTTARHGIESICYSGGDPMAYRDFNRVMGFHIDLNMAFGLTITGIVPSWIDLEQMAKAAWVRVSLDAITPEVYDRVRGLSPIGKVLDGIDRMQQAGVKVCLGITLHTENEADLPNVLAYAADRGITDIDVRHVYPDSLPSQPTHDRHIQPFQHCHASLYQLYINSDGAVYPCCMTAGDTRAEAQGAALGNILTDHWSDVWSRVVSYSRKDLADLPQVCRTCCVQRLSEINAVGDAAPSGPSFF